MSRQLVYGRAIQVVAAILFVNALVNMLELAWAIPSVGWRNVLSMTLAVLLVGLGVALMRASRGPKPGDSTHHR